MDEQKFTELLKKLKIPTNNRSYADIFDLLDAKLSEYLDRQDAESQALVDDIQDALDYAEIKKNEVGSGIALKMEVSASRDALDMDELRGASDKANRERARINSANAGTANAGSASANIAGTNATSGVVAGAQPANGANPVGQQAGKLWFFSLTGADNINTMFYQASDDLKYGEFDHAKSILEAILQVEPQNAGAYLGKAMADFKLKELRDIALAYDKDFVGNINVRRAYDHGNALQKKYLDDAKAELENGKKYKNADKLAMNNTSQIDLGHAKNLFLELGNYRDAAQRAKQCEERIQELKYERAVDAHKNANDSAAYRRAAELYRKMSGYKDADKLAEECEEIANRQESAEREQRQENVLRGDYEKVKNAFMGLAESYKANLDGYLFFGGKKTDGEINITELGNRFGAWKHYIKTNPEVERLYQVDKEIAEAEGLFAEIRKGSAFRSKEGFFDGVVMCSTCAAILICACKCIYTLFVTL